MSAISRCIDRVWFAPAPASRLAVLRIAVGVFVFHHIASRYALYTEMVTADASVFEPTGLARILDAPLSPGLFELLLVVTLVLNALFILGFLHRVVEPLFAVMLLWTLSYRNSWSMIYHSHNLVLLHVVVLGLAPAAGALSLDHWLGRRGGSLPIRRLFTWPEPAGDHGCYGWPIRLMCLLTTLVYFLAGVAKVTSEAGWSWASGESLRGYIARDALRKELLADGAPQLVWFLHDHLIVLTLVAVMTLILELGAPLVMLDRRAARVWAVCALGMHWGIFFIMGIKFRYQLSAIAFLPFFDIDRLPSVLRLGGASIVRRLTTRHRAGCRGRTGASRRVADGHRR